jgi:hypothetical protein
MKSKLDKFFREERKRVFEPGPFFAQRVMAQVEREKIAPIGLWGWVPSAVRPVFALSLAILFVVLAVQILVPVEPPRAALDSFGSQNLSAREQLLLADPQLSAGAAQLEELMVLEPTQ